MADTQFLTDNSHYDGAITTAIVQKMMAEGIVGATHKLGEGSGGLDPLAAGAFSAYKAAGLKIIGGYHVVRSGIPVSSQVTAAINIANQVAPWWKDFPGWLWQTDLEKWPYDAVPASLGIQFSELLATVTGKTVALYASHGEYGDALSAWKGLLWNANYGADQPGAFKALYPGDSSPGWAPYSGQTPTFLQYSSAATVGGLTTTDVSAYRGTFDQLYALISKGANVTTTLTPDDLTNISTRLMAQILGHSGPTVMVALQDTHNNVIALKAELDAVQAQAAANGGSLTALAAKIDTLAAAVAALQAKLDTLTGVDPATLQAAVVAAIKQIVNPVP